MKKLNGNMPIKDLDLSTRGMNALLAEEKLVVVDDVRKLTDYELLRLPNFGKKSLAELREAIGPHVHVPLADFNKMMVWLTAVINEKLHR